MRPILTYSLIAAAALLSVHCKKSAMEEVTELRSKMDAEDESPIFAAIQMERPDLLKYILNNEKPSLDIIDGFGSSPLHCAAKLGRADMVGMLVSAGSDINTPNAEGYLPIHSGAEGGNPEVVRQILAAGANILEPTVAETGYRKEPPLSREARLLQSRAMLYKITAAHPIHVAAKKGNIAVIQLLIELGEKVDAVDSYGNGLVAYARMNGPLVENNNSDRDNRLGVVRMFQPEQPAEAPEESITPEELQRRYIGR